ncbi:outer membrane protein assembly factor BamB family protein [Streptomyces spinoverrucosus]|uniref:outer membrane protein assembly factor BamB family protein n=1 Tax=Streptomyces spinoverrucosus TaxID=284043 RepID=UPI0035AFC56B
MSRRISTTPLVADDAVYIAAFDPGRLVVPDPLSGRELWRKSAGGAFTTTPFMAGDRIGASDRTGVLHAWDPRTRRSTAQLPARWSEEGRGQPAVESRMMFVGERAGPGQGLVT